MKQRTGNGKSRTAAENGPGSRTIRLHHLGGSFTRSPYCPRPTESRAHVQLRPLPNRRDLHCDHSHPRSGCCRKGKLGPSRSASVISSTEIRVFIAFRSSRCTNGHGPYHPCPLHPVSKLSSYSALPLHLTVWTDFSMLIQKAQSGSTAIVSCFLMGTFSFAFALAAPSECSNVSNSLPVTRKYT